MRSRNSKRKRSSRKTKKWTRYRAGVQLPPAPGPQNPRPQQAQVPTPQRPQRSQQNTTNTNALSRQSRAYVLQFQNVMDQLVTVSETSNIIANRIKAHLNLRKEEVKALQNIIRSELDRAVTGLQRTPPLDDNINSVNTANDLPDVQ